MTNRPEPYIKSAPGDLITAEGSNDMQVQIREEIANKVGEVKKSLDDHIQRPVDAAKFGGKTPEEWTQAYDERYVMRSELAAGLGAYRRYFKSLNRQLADQTFEPAIIEHKLGRYPVVDVSELLPLSMLTADMVATGENVNQLRFLVYYANARDRASTKLQTRGNDVVYWGDTITLIIGQLGLKITESQIFDDVLNDLWGAMFNPGDDQDSFEFPKYEHSAYVQTQILDKSLTVKQLKDNGQWEDLLVAIRPKVISPDVEYARAGDGTMTAQVFHLTQNSIEISVSSAADLMVVLRT